MYKDDLYSYTLTVTGTSEDQQKIFAFLSEQKEIVGQDAYPNEKPGHESFCYLVPDGPNDAPYSSYVTPPAFGATSEWNEQEMEEILHAAALQAPNAVLVMKGQNEDDQSYGFKKMFHGDLYQEVKLETHMPPFRDAALIPFEDRYAAHPVPEEPKPMHILCQEFENDSCIREFTILAISENQEDLEQLMKAKIEKDEYGFIAKNGIAESGENFFQTEYVDGVGFVEYYILQQDVLTKDKFQEVLHSEEYDPTFHYPDNLPSILENSIQDLSEQNQYGKVDIQKASQHFLTNKRFQAMVKNAFWASGQDAPHISDELLTIAKEDCQRFILETLRETPDLLEQIGALEPFRYPENLRDILIGSIYDVARDLHLPVIDSEQLAEQYMRNGEFRKLIKEGLGACDHLAEGSEAYQTAVRSCYDFTKADALKRYPECQKNKPLDHLIQTAQKKQLNQREQLTPHQIKKDITH